MRAIWSGSISFGLVNIPIKLYSGTEDTSISFRMLHSSDESPVRFAKICRAEEKEISYKEISRGYEYQKGEFVVLTEEDFEKANLRATHVIDIVSFSEEKEIDVRHYVKSYYLEPDKGAEKAYALLCEALARAKKVGLAKFVLHHREHFAMLKPIGNLLVVETLRYQNEIRSSKSLNLPKEHKLTKKELDMALALINQLTARFNSAEWHDNYEEELRKIIEAKAKGVKPKAKGKVPRNTKVKDLMYTLKASLQKASAKKVVRKVKHRSVG